MTRDRQVGVGCLLALMALTMYLYPMFSRARAKATQTACKCNLQQITLALRIYAMDNDDQLPNMLQWAPLLHPYIMNEAIHICSQDSRRPWGSSFRRSDADDSFDFVSYDMLQRWSDRKFPSDAEAARGIAVYEVGRYGLDYRHLGGMNIGFLDGHVKWYSTEDMTPETILSGRLP